VIRRSLESHNLNISNSLSGSTSVLEVDRAKLGVFLDDLYADDLETAIDLHVILGNGHLLGGTLCEQE
jgi:hypothetical protein